MVFTMVNNALIFCFFLSLLHPQTFAQVSFSLCFFHNAFRKYVAEVNIILYSFLVILKQMSKSVSGNPETDVDIRFVNFLKKLMTKSISEICETDLDIRFVIIFCFF